MGFLTSLVGSFSNHSHNKLPARKPPTMAAAASPASVPRLKYFALPFSFSGRGGAVRFFFLAANQPFEDEVVTFQEWGAGGGKAKTIASKENISGHLPIVTYQGQTLTEHHAIMRLFSRSLGLYGSDAARDYQVDKLADATVEWRNALVEAAFGSDDKKDKYRAEQRPDFYARFEHFLSTNGSAPGYAVSSGGGAVTLADALIFALLWDDAAGFGPAPEGFPRLAALAERFGAIPAVRAWCDKAKQSA